MYIIDGIAYAGEKEKPIKVVSVRPLADYKLWLRFSNGETRVFDFEQHLNAPAFYKLKDKEIFDSVYVDFGVPTWCDGEIDICPSSVYEQSVSVDALNVV